MATLLVVLTIAALLLSPAAALANSGPVGYAAADYGGTLVPVKNDSIAVLSEHLTVDFSGLAAPLDGRMALVPIRATYRLRNESSSQQKALVGFPHWTWRQNDDPLGDPDWNYNRKDDPRELPKADFRVTLDGKPLEYKSVDMDLPFESAPPGDGLLRDLQTRARETHELLREAAWPWNLRAVVFEVDLPPGDEHTLEVSYFQDAGADLFESPRYQLVQLDYVLLTARYWKDFRDLELEVLAPHGARVESSLVLSPVTSQGVDRYIYQSTTLPEANLRVAVALPLPLDANLLSYIGGGNEDLGQMRMVGLLVAIIVIAVCIAVARNRSCTARR